MFSTTIFFNIQPELNKLQNGFKFSFQFTIRKILQLLLLIKLMISEVQIIQSIYPNL